MKNFSHHMVSSNFERFGKINILCIFGPQKLFTFFLFISDSSNIAKIFGRSIKKNFSGQFFTIFANTKPPENNGIGESINVHYEKVNLPN